MKFCFVIVIYNQKISVENYESFDGYFVFCDNSTDSSIKAFNIRALEADCRKFVYLDMNGNKGLARAYNLAISQIPPNYDYVIILDQDTELSLNMVREYEKTIMGCPSIDVVCPIVIFDEDRVLSPSIVCNGSYKVIKSIRSISDTNLDTYSFINSGMCVKYSVFKEKLYDENLFLDMIDHDFVMTARKKHLKFAICHSIKLRQHFSGTEKKTFEQDLSRFNMYADDAKYFYRKWYNKNFKRFLLLRAIKLCVMHKKINFLIDLLKK